MPRTGTGSLEIIAHRCRGFGAPEQSPRAIRETLLRGASPHIGARLSIDGKWVVITGPESPRAVRRVHERSAAQARDVALPLEHALALVAVHEGGAPAPSLYLEAKDAGGERELLRALARLDLIERTILIAWDPGILRRAHAIEPRLRLAVAFVPLERGLRSSRAIAHRALARRRITHAYDPAQRFDGIPGVGATPVHALADDALATLPLADTMVPALLARAVTVERAHARGARIIAWGVHNRLLLRVLRSRGVDGVLTDHAADLITRRA